MVVFICVYSESVGCWFELLLELHSLPYACMIYAHLSLILARVVSIGNLSYAGISRILRNFGLFGIPFCL